MAKETAAQRRNRLAGLASSSDSSAPPFSPQLAAAPPQEQEPINDGRADTVNAAPVRTTVVLAPVEYDRLQSFVHDVSQRTGRRGVAGSEIVRVLLGLLHERPELQAAVREEIGRNGGNRRRGPSGT